MRASGVLIRGSFAVLALCGMMSGPAQARIFIGLGVPLFFPPLFVPPPVYYPPYYGPPQGGYAPSDDTFNYTPPGYAPPGGQPQRLTPPRGYYPPDGYDRPPGGYTPSRGYNPQRGAESDSAMQTCRAGAYVCPLLEDTPPGGACACPGHGGQRIRGQAD
jgi:hypothetical protein